MLQHFRIVGSARYLPERRISSDELDLRLSLPPGTVFAKTGVLYRHEVAEDETATDMAKRVMLEALADAGDLAIRDIDMLIDASLCIQQPIPCNAALIQEALGPEAAGIPCIDIHASCLGFIAAMQMANGLFASGAGRRIAVVCAETTLHGVNWNEPDSACLMGDGAAAVILEASPALSGFALSFETHAEGAELCKVRGGGHRIPPYEYEEKDRASFLFHMDGRGVHKLASRLLTPMVERTLIEADSDFSTLDVVPHQASGPSLELISRRLGIPREQFHVSIAQHGNLVSASIPYVLHGLRMMRPQGTRVMLLGTAAGYAQACCVFAL